MKRVLLLILAAVLLLCGCGKDAPPTETGTESAAETTAMEETAPPQAEITGVFLIQEEIYYDADDQEQAHLTVTFNDQGLPQTIFMDSGADITYTPVYDENGNVTAFSMTRTVYGEETVNHAEVNDHGHIVKQISNAGTDEEQVFETAYSYDEEGRITKETLTRDGSIYLIKLTEYDEHGNKTRYEEINNASSDMSFVSSFTNTYEDGLLVEKECAVDGVLDYTTAYIYDDNGRCTQERTDNGWVKDYAYNEHGLMTLKTITVNGKESYRYVYEYDENGAICGEVWYINGEYSRRTAYVCTLIQAPLTDAHMTIFEKLSIVP